MSTIKQGSFIEWTHNLGNNNEAAFRIIIPILLNIHILLRFLSFIHNKLTRTLKRRVWGSDSRVLVLMLYCFRNPSRSSQLLSHSQYQRKRWDRYIRGHGIPFDNLTPPLVRLGVNTASNLQELRNLTRLRNYSIFKVEWIAVQASEIPGSFPAPRLE